MIVKCVPAGSGTHGLRAIGDGVCSRPPTLRRFAICSSNSGDVVEVVIALTNRDMGVDVELRHEEGEGMLAGAYGIWGTDI